MAGKPLLILTGLRLVRCSLIMGIKIYIIAILMAGFGGLFSTVRIAMCFKRMGTQIFILTALVLISPQANSNAEAWTFAVVGDSRGNGYTYKDGVNWKILKNIAENIKDNKCDLVVFPGDLIQGSTKHLEQYKSWRNAMAPVLNARIPVYPVRGNHEEWGDANGTHYKTFVNTALKIPQNGPQGPPDERSFTYSFTHKNAFFVGLDEYFHRSGKRHKINQAWLNTQLQNNDRNKHPHVFVYAHTPAFKVSCSSSSTGALYDDPSVRKNLWTSLHGHGVRAYFCGHVHFYTANMIKGYGTPELYQICNGIGGATLDPYEGNIDKNHVIIGKDKHGEYRNVVEAKNIGGYYGYNLVHVDGNKVRIDLMVWHNTKKYWETKKGIYKGSYTVN